jgi:hypothetical protein
MRSSRARKDGVGRLGAKRAKKKGAGEAWIKQLESGGGVDMRTEQKPAIW